MLRIATVFEAVVGKAAASETEPYLPQSREPLQLCIERRPCGCRFVWQRAMTWTSQEILKHLTVEQTLRRAGLGAADDKNLSWEAHAIGGGIPGQRGEHLLGHFESLFF